MLRCSMSGQPMEGFADGIYDDGEWISWAWINQQIYEQELKAEYPHVVSELAELFESMVESAAHYHAMTGRYLQIWGELGELYAEVKYGLRRHKPKTPGSDGRLGNDYVEVKTISPEKNANEVQVKRSGSPIQRRSLRFTNRPLCDFHIERTRFRSASTPAFS